MVDAVPMSSLVAAVDEPRAVLIALHGGATSSAYFDCPGHPRLSLLRAAAAHGFTAIALDRPGYGASALYQDEMGSADRRVELALRAVAAILGENDCGAGTFVMAHSAGCELGLRMAADDGAGAIGVALAGTGLRYRADALAIIDQATMTTRPAGLRALLWEPVALYPPEVLTGALAAGGAAYEGEVTANWPRRDFAEVAARVRVPVHFTVADHEAVWETGPESSAGVAALFTAAPRVVVDEMPDSGHNLSVGLTAQEYHQRVLSFAGACVESHELQRRAL
ncbi:thioesterase [Mycolicibacterium madagascariense]|uniref:Thioesterase n=1 Tax=Mycolicibacterium madagascariense TaxID=212765 RepID=A0A7I7XKE8_9MYCO|nr:alpha/beta hydrolase [Mycolicibacterium madagascariense]MCV7012116.1 alpha/beta fold hydrolase [Mycolicibacterium madagascariense]BBZ29625.1 thioesterase [Mycolicibacterium madagascariense]